MDFKIETKKIELFDKNGQRLYFYDLYTEDTSYILASLVYVEFSAIREEIEAANTDYENYQKENEIALYGKPLSEMTQEEFNNSLDNVEIRSFEEIDNKYPLSKIDSIYRICYKFNMFIWEADEKILNRSLKHMRGCMGDD